MLPFVKFVMNNSVHSVTGYSPLTLLYGATIGNRQTKELIALANEDTPVVSATQEEYNEWFRNRDTQQSAVLQVAQSCKLLIMRSTCNLFPLNQLQNSNRMSMCWYDQSITH